MEPLPPLPSLVNLTPAKRGREPPPDPPRDDGTGPLRFYCSKNDGVRAGKTPLLNEADRNECGGRSILGNFYKSPSSSSTTACSPLRRLGLRTSRSST